MFTVSIDRSLMGDIYLDAYPEGSNEIYIERTKHDCNTCKQFIRFIGTVVTINEDGTLDTVWDVEGLDYPYDVVAKNLADRVKSTPIKTVFYIMKS